MNCAFLKNNTSKCFVKAKKNFPDHLYALSEPDQPSMKTLRREPDGELCLGFIPGQPMLG